MSAPEYGAARAAFAAWQANPANKQLADRKEDALRDLARVAGKPSHVLHDLLVVEWRKQHGT